VVDVGFVFSERLRIFFALTKSLNYELSVLIPVDLFKNVHLICLGEFESYDCYNNATATFKSSRERSIRFTRTNSHSVGYASNTSFFSTLPFDHAISYVI
jgi:hypothetical protein